MAGSLFLILLGVALLYAGAEALVRGAVAIATQLGITPLVIGLTIVAMGTSMPEMVVSVAAALRGSGEIAVGNIVGSNIGNIALILGVAALIAPTLVQARVVRVEMPLVVVVSVLVSVMLWDGEMGRLAGAVLVPILVGYLVVTIRRTRKEGREAKAEFAESLPETPRRTWLNLLLVVVGLGLLVGGARMLVSGAVTIAQDLGINEAIIGLTIVAIGTSLPEMATSVVAALKGQGDIAIGNVVGSNLFNMTGILGVAALVSPLHDVDVGMVSLLIMTILSFVLLPLMKSGERVSRLEGGLLLAAYVGYIVYLMP